MGQRKRLDREGDWTETEMGRRPEKKMGLGRRWDRDRDGAEREMGQRGK